LKFAEENAASRWELQNLIAGLSDADFDRPAGGGWTVATILCHLAFWDLRVFYALPYWEDPSFRMAPMAPDAVDSINRAARPVFGAISGRAAAQLALESAGAVDAQLEKLSGDIAARIAGAGFERHLRRSLHRREHLRKIEEALGER
jgi:hypothetical protein